MQAEVFNLDLLDIWLLLNLLQSIADDYLSSQCHSCIYKIEWLSQNPLPCFKYLHFVPLTVELSR